MHRRTPYEINRQAFSLVELLVVVSIVAIGLTLAGPRVQDAQIGQAQSEFMRATILMAKHTRGEALAYGRAHSIFFQPDQEGGRFTVYRGVGPTCNGNDWFEVIGRGNCAAAGGTTCLMQLAASDYSLFGATFEIDAIASFDPSATPPDGAEMAGPFMFCYSAMGDMMYSYDGSLFLNNSTAVAGFEGGVILRIQRTVNGAIQGVHRRILLRLGGDVGQLT